MEPWEVVNTVDNFPYAVRTMLGRVNNGSLKRKDCTVFKKEMSTSVLRFCIAAVETLLLQQINLDFPRESLSRKTKYVT